MLNLLGDKVKRRQEWEATDCWTVTSTVCCSNNSAEFDQFVSFCVVFFLLQQKKKKPKNQNTTRTVPMQTSNFKLNTQFILNTGIKLFKQLFFKKKYEKRTKNNKRCHHVHRLQCNWVSSRILNGFQRGHFNTWQEDKHGKCSRETNKQTKASMQPVQLVS